MDSSIDNLQFFLSVATIWRWRERIYFFPDSNGFRESVADENLVSLRRRNRFQ
jgi:hypothetical protein